jgi:hypothetical protein
MVLVYKHVVPNGTKSGKAFPHIKRLSRKERNHDRATCRMARATT